MATKAWLALLGAAFLVGISQPLLKACILAMFFVGALGNLVPFSWSLASSMLWACGWVALVAAVLWLHAPALGACIGRAGRGRSGWFKWAGLALALLLVALFEYGVLRDSKRLFVSGLSLLVLPLALYSVTNRPAAPVTSEA